jgi:hypothetical protein
MPVILPASCCLLVGFVSAGSLGCGGTIGNTVAPGNGVAPIGAGPCPLVATLRDLPLCFLSSLSLAVAYALASSFPSFAAFG